MAKVGAASYHFGSCIIIVWSCQQRARAESKSTEKEEQENEKEKDLILDSRLNNFPWRLGIYAEGHQKHFFVYSSFSSQTPLPFPIRGFGLNSNTILQYEYSLLSEKDQLKPVKQSIYFYIPSHHITMTLSITTS